METIIFNFFGILFRTVGVLILVGVFVAVLTDMQKKAFDNHHRGLISLRQVNEQLVGKTKWLKGKER